MEGRGVILSQNSEDIVLNMNSTLTEFGMKLKNASMENFQSEMLGMHQKFKIFFK